jgi:hypothetical protein
MTAAAPVLPSTEEFKKNTTPKSFVRRGRGSKLNAIDTALEAWNDGIPAPSTNAQALLNIIHACRTWFKAKDDKNEKGETTTNRRPHVKALADTAFERLQYETFQKNKEKIKNSTTLNGPSIRMLQGGYANEYYTYRNSGKTHAYSGSTVATLAEYSHDPLKRANHAVKGNQLPPNLDFNNMTDQQFEQLARNFGEPLGFMKEVFFMKKAERIKRTILIENGLMYNSGTTLFQTRHEWAYAIDEYGDLISTDDQALEELLAPQSQRFNHSTYNAGKSVICAGMIRVRAGRLEHIDNASGHYKPEEDNLINALGLLAGLGVDLSKVTAMCMKPSPTHGNQTMCHYYSNAALYLGNKWMPPTVVK